MELVYNSSLLWFVIGYGILMIVLGIFYSKKVSTSDDFILAGKSLGPIVLMGTLLATWVGSGTVTGGPNSLAYSYGFWPALWYVIPSVIGIGVIYLISSKIRNYGKYTVSEILEMKYGAGARALSALIIILAYVLSWYKKVYVFSSYTFKLRVVMSSSKHQPAPKLQVLMRKQAFDSVLPAPASG
ncbi:hypothetical protein [Paenisporosarcina sp. TG20]|uniref:sodium:solute symporter family transporter n=1 Tax=Paenisporosarcina sp. TG20 TaxID=1211706 RepID=UPI0002F56ED3